MTRWKWLWIDDQNTGLPLLIRLLNLRLKALADFLATVLVGGSGKIEFYCFNDGAVLLPGDSDWGYIDVACRITAAQLVADPAGSVTMHVYTTRYPTWDAWTMISTATPISLSSANKAQPSISGWATTITAGTYMKIAIVGSVSGIRKATLTLFLTPES